MALLTDMIDAPMSSFPSGQASETSAAATPTPGTSDAAPAPKIADED